MASGFIRGLDIEKDERFIIDTRAQRESVILLVGKNSAVPVSPSFLHAKAQSCSEISTALKSIPQQPLPRFHLPRRVKRSPAEPG